MKKIESFQIDHRFLQSQVRFGGEKNLYIKESW